MNFYQDNKAPPLPDYSPSEVKTTLISWRNLLREDLECLIYVKKCITNAVNKNGYDDMEQGRKIIKLIPKLEALCLKGIECINEFMKEINNENRDVEINAEKMYCKVETIRENYNKIVVNIQKMITTAPGIKDYVEIYLSKKTPTNEKGKELASLTSSPNQSCRNINKPSVNSPVLSEGNIKDNWVNKLYNDIELFQTMQAHKVKQNSTRQINQQQQNKKQTRNFNQLSLNQMNIENDNTAQSVRSFFRENPNHKQSKRRSLNLQDNIVQLKESQFKQSNSPKERVITTVVNNKSNNNEINTFCNSVVTTNITRAISKNSKQQSVQNKSNVHKGIYKKFYDEIKHIKSFIERLEREFRNHCIVSKEKENFENLKKENIKLMVDVSILKEDMIDVIKKYQELNSKIELLEKENKELKLHNENLMSLIKKSSKNEENVKENKNNFQQLEEFKAITLNLENLNKLMNEHISELSSHRAYENLQTHSTNNNNNNYALNSNSSRFNENTNSIYQISQPLYHTKSSSADKPTRYLIPKKSDY